MLIILEVGFMEQSAASWNSRLQLLYVKVDVSGPCPVLVCSQELQTIPCISICKDFHARIENSATRNDNTEGFRSTDTDIETPPCQKKADVVGQRLGMGV